MSLAGPLRILVVDDDPVMTELLSALLELEGHTVRTADSGEAALNILSSPNAPPQVVLTDMQLPGLHGVDLAAALRAKLPEGCVLLGMSGSKPTSGEREACDAFLLKPFTVDDFAAAVAGTSSDSVEPAPPASSGPTILDEGIFAKMSAQLPAAQLRQLYELTLNDSMKRVDRMKTSLEAGDLAEVHREAHAIKGGAGMVGATELHQLAARVEAGSLGDTPPKTDMAELIAACDRLRRMLDARFNH